MKPLIDDEPEPEPESDDGYCGKIVWSKNSGGYNGVDGQCCLPAGHEGDCQC